MSNPVKLPKKLKIANHIFDIEEKDADWNHENCRHGECYPSKLKIRICTIFPHSQTYETLLHEIGHAIYYAYNIQDSDTEERIVTQFSTGLAQVMTDNPDLVKYLAAVPK